MGICRKEAIQLSTVIKHRVPADHSKFSTVKNPVGWNEYQAYLSAKAFIAKKTSSDVSAPLTISINFIIGGGFIKCMPITCNKLKKKDV